MKIFRLLLKLYPARFREEYGTPLERQFADDYRDAQGTTRARVMFWIHALADLAISIPTELAHELSQDVGYALRMYRRRSVISVLALLALAMAIGATTGVFSVVDALLLRSLPFRDAERLVQLRQYAFEDSIAGLDAWRRKTHYLDDLAVYRAEDMNLAIGGASRRVRVAETSANFFRLLGTNPEIGRPFATGEDTPGRDNVAVISTGLWKQLFGGDPRTLGRVIHVNGQVLTVIGIAPPALDYPEKTAVWTPTIFHFMHLTRENSIIWTAIGRLKKGVQIAHASELYRADMKGRWKGNPIEAELWMDTRITPLRDLLAGSVRQASLVLFCMVSFVLLTACANVAHLLLSRVTERQQELALRSALGASRPRLVQQLVTESTMLTVAAAVAGLGIAHWALRLASIVQPAGLAAQEYRVLDGRVLGFAVGVALLTGFVFGVLPARLLGRLRSQAIARDTGVRRMRAVLIAMQTAFTLVLVAGALSMSRDFLKLMGTDLGIRTDHVVTMNVALGGTPREEAQEAYYRQALERLRAVPGVESAGAVEFLPIATHTLGVFNLKVDGNGREYQAVPIRATPNYLRTMGTPILRGRDFTAADERGTKSVVVVNEAFARQLDPGLGVVGRIVISPADQKRLTIIGVARTERYFGPTDEGMPQVFMLAAGNTTPNITLVARVLGKTEAYLPICRDTVEALDRKVPVFNVMTFDELLRDAFAHPRFYTTVMTFFGGFALLLAVIGIYGVASFSIIQRTHEIGVRMAVGASQGRVRRMLLRESLLPVAAGMIAGVAGAAVLGRLLEHLMEGADPIGTPTCIAASALLFVTATIAVWAAARRIAHLDPMRILRAD